MRIVSLVPSLTETLFALGCEEDELVGRTAWCTEPADRVALVPVIGGTKTPNVRRILELRPDVVLMEREENPEAVHGALVAGGLTPWVTHVTAVADVPAMLRDLGRAVGRPGRGEGLARDLERDVLGIERYPARPRALIFIWNDPVMVMGPARYGGDLVNQCGFEVLDPVPGEGYPVLTDEALRALKPEVLLFTSEPHAFTEAEAQGLVRRCEGLGLATPIAHLVDGQALTWFGARTQAGLAWWREFRRTRG